MDFVFLFFLMIGGWKGRILREFLDLSGSQK